MNPGLRRVAVVLVIGLTACSNNDRPVREAATSTSSTTSTANGSAAGGAPNAGSDTPEDAAADDPAANAPAAASGERSPTPHSRGDTATQSGEFVFLVTTNDPGRDRPSTWSYDVVTKSTGDNIDATWTLRYDNPPEHRKLRKSGDALVGIHLPGQAGEYMDCDWKPAPVNIPRLEVGVTATLDSRCEHSYAFPPDHHHLTGSVKVTGTREVRFNGQTLTVWIIERQWRHVVAEDRNDEFTMRAVSWWSPDLSMIVRSEATLNQPPHLPQPAHATVSSKLFGLEE